MIRVLSLLSLERRDVPATFGVPWPDSHRLTVSFVPDGTPVGSAPGEVSRLFAKLDTLMPRADWQREILRGIQAWASHTGLNLVVVPDSGDPLGSPGLPQGDSRFGDVRIAGLPLSPGSVSDSVPFSANAGTWSGDILFNTEFTLGTEYDLATVTMHEAGHVLGLAGTLDDPGSVLFEYYTGPATGPTPSDIARLHALAGPRPADAFERVPWFRDAALRSLASALVERDEDAPIDQDLPFAVDADLSLGDVDEYRYVALGSFTVRLETVGRSLLSGRVSVIDARGQVVAAGSGELTVPARLGTTWRLRVESADEDFAAGAYRLVVRERGGQSGSELQQLASRLNRNDTRARATILPVGEAYRGRLDRAGDVDYYRLDPLLSTSLDVQFWGAGTMQLLDARGMERARGQGELRVAGLTAGQVYYLRVSGLSGAGAYLLSAREGVPASVPTLVATGLLDPLNAQQFRGLFVPQSGLIHLQIDMAGSSPGTAMEAVLFDPAGNRVWSEILTDSTTVALHLPRGAYTLRFVGAVSEGATWNVPFAVRTTRMSDPIGPRLIDPTTPPQARFIDPVWFEGGFVNTVAVIDPFGRPLPFIDPPPVIFLPPEW